MYCPPDTDQAKTLPFGLSVLSNPSNSSAGMALSPVPAGNLSSGTLGTYALHQGHVTWPWDSIPALSRLC